MATGNGENPLLNDVVLDVIFQHVTRLRDLKSARQVCGSWWKGALRQWRQVGVLVLLQKKKKIQSKSTKKKSSSGPGGGGGCEHDHHDQYHASIAELASLMELDEADDGDGDNRGGGLQLERRPYQRIRLKEWRFYGDAFWEEHLFGDKLGGFVTYLHFDRCTFQRFSVLDELLTRKLPVLKTLVWSDCTFLVMEDRLVSQLEDFLPVLKRDHGQRQHFQRSLKTLQVTRDCDWEGAFGHRQTLTALLYAMPSVEELCLRIFHKNDLPGSGSPDFWVGSLFGAINNIKELHNNDDDADGDGGTGTDKFHIRTLDIMDYFTNASARFFHDWTGKEKILDSLRLERLTVDIGALTTLAEARHIFSANPQTLKVLKAFRAPIMPLSPAYNSVPFVEQMSALEELHLWGNLTTNLEFLKYTPNLRTLVLKSDCFDKMYKLESLLEIPENYIARYGGDLVAKTLKDIRGCGPRKRRGHNIGGEALALLSVSSLTHLDTDYNFSAKSILTLASWLPNVSTLKMVLTNKSLEAVSRAWPAELTELELLFGSVVDDDGITYLQRLPKLKKFKSNAYCNQGLISSSSLDRVFLKMKTLTSLEICVSNKMRMSAETELKRHINSHHVKVIRNYDVDPDDHHHHHNHECCERMKFR